MSWSLPPEVLHPIRTKKEKRVKEYESDRCIHEIPVVSCEVCRSRK